MEARGWTPMEREKNVMITRKRRTGSLRREFDMLELLEKKKKKRSKIDVDVDVLRGRTQY